MALAGKARVAIQAFPGHENSRSNSGRAWVSMIAEARIRTVAVVVLNWNGGDDTIACLNSLRSLDYPAFSVIVVDNGSEDDSVVRIHAAHADVSIIETGKNLGFGGGCNVGIRAGIAGGADYVWLINNDATVAADTLSEMVRTAEQDPRTGAVGSVIFDQADRDHLQLWGGGNVNLWTGASRHRKTPGAVDFVSGASALFRAQALAEVGCFDEANFFMYWEDSDLGFRLRKAGWKLAVAERSRVWHEESSSLGRGSPKLIEYFTRSGVVFLRKHAAVPLVSISVNLTARTAKLVLSGDLAGASFLLRVFYRALRSKVAGPVV